MLRLLLLLLLLVVVVLLMLLLRLLYVRLLFQLQLMLLRLVLLMLLLVLRLVFRLLLLLLGWQGRRQEVCSGLRRRLVLDRRRRVVVCIGGLGVAGRGRRRRRLVQRRRLHGPSGGGGSSDRPARASSLHTTLGRLLPALLHRRVPVVLDGVVGSAMGYSRSEAETILTAVYRLLHITDQDHRSTPAHTHGTHRLTLPREATRSRETAKTYCTDKRYRFHNTRSRLHHRDSAGWRR